MLLGGFLKISGEMRNWGRWSDIVVVRLPNIISVGILEKILSIIVFELEVTLVAWIMYGRNIDEARKSKNSLVGECCSYFERSTYWPFKIALALIDLSKLIYCSYFLQK